MRRGQPRTTVRPISQRVNYYDSPPPMPVNGNIETFKRSASRATGFVVFVLLPTDFFFSRRFSNFFLLFVVFEYRPTRNIAAMYYYVFDFVPSALWF